MCRRILSSLIILLFASTSLFGQIDVEKIKNEVLDDHIMGSGQMGRKFIVAFPPNEKADHPNDVLEIYVSSAANTTVTLRNDAIGVEITKQVKALEITKFSSGTGELSFNFELREEGVVRPYGFVLESPHPISVYVLNSKPVSSDGYMAIPLSSWGKEYIHNSFYDFREIKKWRTGFMILGAYDNTKVRIKLKGVNHGGGKTASGHELGDNIYVTLDENDVYMVQGDGETRGVFDLSGSHITSDKPIALLSFHERTMIPAFEVYNGRDHLIEMMPPVQAWGKKYVTVEYARGTDKGDFFRMISSESDNKVNVKWYNLDDGQFINSLSKDLEEVGDWEEYLHAPVKHPHDLESIRGTSVFEFDKPGLVCQYDYSAEWDGVGGKFDPFMIVLQSVEQFTNQCVFLTPDNKEFNENYFNIIAIGDSTDPNSKLLKSITLDGNSIQTLQPTFIYSRIPGTNYYWAKLSVNLGAHVLKGDTKFGGYIYGFSSYDTYGWPAAMNIKNLDETDTLEPEIRIEGDCGNYKIQASELRNGKDGDNPLQVDQGISDYPELVHEYSYNFKEPEMVDPEWSGWPPSYQYEDYEFRLEVEDLYQDGFAIFTVVDRYGNIAIDSVRYEADSIGIKPKSLEFAQVRVQNTDTIDLSINNLGNNQIQMSSISLKNNTVFQLIGSIPRSIGPYGSVDFELTYTPTVQYPELPEEMDVDTLIIKTTCMEYHYPVTGQGVEPIIWVADWEAENIEVNQIIYNENGLWIRNKGTMALEITGVDEVPAPFTLSDTTDPEFPFTIEPNNEVYFKLIGFAPTEIGEYDEIMTFLSNATVDENTNEAMEKAVVHLAGKSLPSPVLNSDNYFNNLVLEPNPVTEDYFNIKYSIANGGTVNIEMVTINGKSTVLFDSYKTQGHYSLEVATKDMPSGVYSIRLTIGNFSKTEKIIINK